MKPLLILVLLGSPAWAGFEADHLQLATTAGFLATEGAGPVRAWEWRTQAAYRFSDASLVLERGGRAVALVGARSFVEVSGSIELGRWVGLGVALPVLLDGGGALGDLRLVPRVELVQRKHFGLALLLSLRVPTGDPDKFAGEGGALFEPRVATQVTAGIVRIALNAGVRIRKTQQLYDLRVGNECFASLALAVAPKPYFDALVELHADSALDGGFGQAQRSPVELLFGVGGGARGVRAGVAAGVGLVDGYGVPRVRALVTLEVRRAPEVARPLARAVARLTERPQLPSVPPPPATQLQDLPDIDESVAQPEAEPDAPDVIVAAGRIELADPIFFQTNRKRIRHRYFDELMQLGRVLERRTELTSIYIEGHADATGPERWNLELSRSRAVQVVAFLVAHGVDGARLHPVGFGEARPLEPGPPIANERNRRVHFFTESSP